MSKRPAFGSQFEKLRALGVQKPLDEQKPATDPRGHSYAEEGALTLPSSNLGQSVSAANSIVSDQYQQHTVCALDSVQVEQSATGPVSKLAVSKPARVQDTPCESGTVSPADAPAAEGFTRAPHWLLQGTTQFDDTWSTQTMQVAANLGLLKDICIVNPVSYDATSSSSQNRKFIADYKRRFTETPSDVAALAYDAGILINKASDKCLRAVSRKRCMAEAIPQIRFRGVSGNVQFAKTGKRVNTGTLLKSTACARLESEGGFHE